MSYSRISTIFSRYNSYYVKVERIGLMYDYSPEQLSCVRDWIITAPLCEINKVLNELWKGTKPSDISIKIHPSFATIDWNSIDNRVFLLCRMKNFSFLN